MFSFRDTDSTRAEGRRANCSREMSFILEGTPPLSPCYTCPGGTPYNGLYGETPPERGTFFRLQVFKRVGISQVEVYKRVWKSVI